MTQEEKQLLLVDICARLPYGVICEIYNDTCTIKEKLLFGGISRFADDTICVRPFLRPMSSMTEKEKKEYESLCILIPINYDSDLSKYDYYTTDSIDSFDWLNAHYFDYRGLIEKGLALEAPKGMYN